MSPSLLGQPLQVGLALLALLLSSDMSSDPSPLCLAPCKHLEWELYVLRRSTGLRAILSTPGHTDLLLATFAMIDQL